MNIKTIRNMIENNKKILLKKAKKSGIYENFGVEEVKKVREAIENMEYFVYDEKLQAYNMLDNFSNWCGGLSYNNITS